MCCNATLDTRNVCCRTIPAKIMFSVKKRFIISYHLDSFMKHFVICFVHGRSDTRFRTLFGRVTCKTTDTAREKWIVLAAIKYKQSIFAYKCIEVSYYMVCMGEHVVFGYRNLFVKLKTKRLINARTCDSQQSRIYIILSTINHLSSAVVYCGFWSEIIVNLWSFNKIRLPFSTVIDIYSTRLLAIFWYRMRLSFSVPVFKSCRFSTNLIFKNKTIINNIFKSDRYF